MADPLDALRRFDGPVAPDPAFAADLRRRLLPRSRPVITTATATPYLIVADARAALAFYVAAFDAEVTSRMEMDDGRIGHAELTIGGAPFMLADEFPELGYEGPLARGGTTVSIHLDVEDVDAATESAVAAGATLERAPEDQFHGNRNAVIVDPAGHRWMLSTPLF
ncbi:MAG: hypothetical protein JWO68_720 [Actinomycetia bacterium]|nr:hypothetical protein [Actinomycetes bacterium]